MMRMVRGEGLLTVAAIGALAYIVAALVHEAVGHGAMCVSMGGEERLLTSLFSECSIQRPVIALAGPVANIAFGLSCFVGVDCLQSRAGVSNLLSFLWVSAAYNLFFGLGYLLFSAVTGHGDWAFLFGTKGATLADRGLLLVLGIVAMATVRRLLGSQRPNLTWTTLEGETKDGTWAVYVTASLVSIVAATLDPASLHSVLLLPPAAPLAGLGLLSLRGATNRAVAVKCHRGWVFLGVAGGVAFIALLGPGIALAN